MTRLDELTLESADRALTPDEQAELERLLAASPEQGARVVLALEIEANLRGDRQARDLAPEIVAAVLRRREDRVVTGVMNAVRESASRPEKRRRGRASYAMALAALCMTLLAWAAVQRRRAPEPIRPEPGARSPGADPSGPPAFRRDPHLKAETPPANGSTSATAAIDSEPPIVYFEADFEDGVTSDHLSFGAVVPGPEREGNRFVVQGTLGAYSTKEWLITIAFQRAGVAMAWSDDLVVAFDYWVASGGNGITVQVFDTDQRQNHKLILSDVETGRWAHAVVKFSDLRPVLRSEQRPAPGDRLLNLVFAGGETPDKPLFIDNIKIYE